MALAFIIYQLALNFATGDCSSLQQDMRAQGPLALSLFLLIATLLAAAGLPTAILSALGGILFGSFPGGSLVSVAICIASISAWALARTLWSNGMFPSAIENRLKKQWFEDMMNDRTDSGFHWVMKSANRCPLPFPYFCAIVGVKVQHLNLIPIIAGLFASSFIHVAAYSLAGGSIGCAVMNHALGLDISEFRPAIIASCLILMLLAQIDSFRVRRSSI